MVLFRACGGFGIIFRMTTRFTVDGKKVSLLGYGAMRLPAADGGHANNWRAKSARHDW